MVEGSQEVVVLVVLVVVVVVVEDQRSDAEIRWLKFFKLTSSAFGDCQGPATPIATNGRRDGQMVVADNWPAYFPL